jgi:hypothetical protein
MGPCANSDEMCSSGPSVGFHREVSSTVDEVNQNRPKRSRVLRAADVIPPFDKCIPPVDDGATEREPSPPMPCGTRDNEGGSEGYFAAGAADLAAEPLSGDAVEIPEYDLAENILAEQRRAAGRRRRGPGRVEESVASLRGSGMRLSVPDLASPDLQELQRMVAEIVAGDIERLCRRSVQAVYS